MATRGTAAIAPIWMSCSFFFQELDTEVTFAKGDEVGLPRHPFTQIWRHRFRAVVDPQTPVFAAPLRPKCMGPECRRVRCLGLCDVQERAVFWGSGYRSAMKKVRPSAAPRTELVRERNLAVSSNVSKRPRSLLPPSPVPRIPLSSLIISSGFAL